MEGLVSPSNPFPKHEYLTHVFNFLSLDPTVSGTESKVRLIPKSRDLMLTWSCVGFLTHMAMTGYSVVALQSQNKDKAEALIHYAKVLYDNQPQFLKDSFPLKKGYRLEDFPRDRLDFANGSTMVGIPEGADQIRSSHPTALLMDEAGFQPEGRGAYDTAYHACGYMILLSTAWPSFFSELCVN